MKMAFSTLACPDWTFAQIVAMASAEHYDGVELRFVEGQDSLYKLPAFRGDGLTATRRILAENGLTICCLDTSCRFHFPDARERANWIEEGERMAALAAELGAPGIRVFGDQIQPGADRESTRNWIAESIRVLADRVGDATEIWLETHGDFASAPETMSILWGADTQRAGVIWDPANCWTDSGEQPDAGAAALGTSIRHVHIKDMHRSGDTWNPVLTGEGSFPLSEVRDSLRRLKYQGFVAYEWEKKWHPEIPDATIALPHFAKWFRENWS
jgi:sugar phosphate isomerase/epimerase